MTFHCLILFIVSRHCYLIKSLQSLFLDTCNMSLSFYRLLVLDILCGISPWLNKIGLKEGSFKKEHVFILIQLANIIKWQPTKVEQYYLFYVTFSHRYSYLHNGELLPVQVLLGAQSSTISSYHLILHTIINYSPRNCYSLQLY